MVAGDPTWASRHEQAVADMVELRRLSHRLLWSFRSHWERRAWRMRSWIRMGLPTTLGHLIFAFPREVVRALAQAGRQVRAAHGVPLTRQLLHMIGAAFRWGIYPKDYYLFSLYREGRIRLAPLYLGPRCNGDSLLAAVGARDPQQSKLEFHRRCTAAGLPTIPILAECSSRGEPPSVYDDESPLWGGDLCTKPADAGSGRGVKVWLREARGGWRDGDLVARDRAELLSILASRKNHDTWIVQPRVVTHDALADLTTGAVCNLRVNTVRDPATGAVEILFAMFRMPRSAEKKIIGSGDGVYAGVDLETGRLGKALDKITYRLPEYVALHPVTEGRIEGRVLPFWTDVLEVSELVHQAYPEVPAVGWDIMIAESGPVLGEANELWAAELVQATNDTPIGLTAYPRVMLKYLRAARTRRALERRF